MTVTTFMAMLDAVNRAGFGWKSEWLGDLGDGSRIAKFTVFKGRRKKGEWFGPNPQAACEKACKEMRIEYTGQQMMLGVEP